MPAAYSNIVIKDGNANVIPGNVAALDQSGLGTGPWNFANIIVDGVSGINRLAVTSGGSLNVTIGTSGNIALETGGNLATIAGAIVSQGTALGAIKELMVAGSVTSGVPTYTPGQISPVSLDGSGLLRISWKDTPANTNNLNVAIAGSTAAVTVQTSGSSLSDNIAQVNGVTVAAGNGIATTGSMRVCIASDNTANSNPFLTTPRPDTSGGCTVSSYVIASGTNATSVKGTAANLYGIQATNNSGTIGYLKIYDTSGTPTAGAGTPKLRIMVPANTLGAGIVFPLDLGVVMTSGIGFTFTGGITDADTTAVANNAFLVNLIYK